MTTVEVSSEIPERIIEGLKAGLYERVGGAIRDAATEEIVAWLREAFDASEPVVSEVVSEVLSLAATPANAQPLNLALTTMQFAVVMKRLDAIQTQLKRMQEVLQAIDYKIDLSFYANFRAALDLASNTFTISNPQTRHVSAMQAVNRFLEAEHQYTELADVEIANKSQVADDYLYTLCLAYVTEAWCYLELGELETAHFRLRDGLSVVRPRFERHTRTLLTSNPAAYLHPSLKGRIDLKRLTRIYRWLDPKAEESSVFEAQRENLFRLAQHPDEWQASLPPAIQLPAKGRTISAKLIGELAKQLDTRNIAKRMTGLVDALRHGHHKPVEEPEDDVFSRLPDTAQLIELMIEHCSRFESYLAEVRTVRESGMSFAEWRSLRPTDGGRAAPGKLICITMSPSVH